MNYEKIYKDLINQATVDPKPDDYKELHHIIPRCLGGNDDRNNLVKLTARQHFLSHWLLYKIHRTPELVYAWNCMRVIGKGQESRNVNSHLFEYAKRHKSKILSENSFGENNNFYGKKHTEESRRKMSEKLTGKKHSEETRRKMSIKRRGVPKSIEHKSKIGRIGMVSLKNIHTGESVRILKSEYSKYDKDVWINSYSYKMRFTDIPDMICCVCGKVGKDNSSFKRWHNDNCKELKK